MTRIKKQKANFRIPKYKFSLIAKHCTELNNMFDIGIDLFWIMHSITNK